jgi:hypothetical protein
MKRFKTMNPEEGKTKKALQQENLKLKQKQHAAPQLERLDIGFLFASPLLLITKDNFH